MKEYSGEHMEEVVLPERLEVWDREHVMVTHDECCFYSNDAKASVWLEDDESVIRKKGQGGTIMVSDFLCPCHGPMRVAPDVARRLNIPERARIIIQPGANADGYWKSEHMVAQIRDQAIPIFNYLHEGCTGELHFALLGSWTVKIFDR